MGRKTEGRERLILRVLPATAAKLTALAVGSTLGKALDKLLSGDPAQPAAIAPPVTVRAVAIKPAITSTANRARLSDEAELARLSACQLRGFKA